MRIILDTGPLVALLNRKDAYHAWTTRAFDRVSPPLWTCEPVLTEAAHLTGAGQQITAMVSAATIRIGLELEDQADAIAALLGRYGAEMDLADACLVRMSELMRNSRVFTLDRRGFAFFRRNGREVIPLLAPSV